MVVRVDEHATALIAVDPTNRLRRERLHRIQHFAVALNEYVHVVTRDAGDEAPLGAILHHNGRREPKALHARCHDFLEHACALV